LPESVCYSGKSDGANSIAMNRRSYKKRSKTGPHSMYTSEQNTSTEIYPFTDRIRKIFCKNVFDIQANLKE
jgi:hypothetical protein